MPENLPEKSKSLDKIPIPVREYKPARLPVREKRPFPYVPLIFGLLILLITLLIGFLVSENSQSDLTDVTVMPEMLCLVTTGADVNVRTGPGYDYGRAWILSRGEQRQAVARVGYSWYQIENGWLPREAISLNTSTPCMALPQPDSPPLFEDDLVPPEAIIIRGWGETLGESFATDANEWRGARLFEGNLVLESDEKAAPARDQIRSYADAYYTFEAFFESGSRLIFVFRSSDVGEYQLHIQREGQLQLLMQPPEGNATLLETATIEQISLRQPFVVGILSDGQLIEVFWNGESLFSVEYGRSDESQYAFVAWDSTVYVKRFEVIAPLHE